MFLIRLFIKLKPHLWPILVLIIATGFVFAPVMQFDFQDWDYMELEYYLRATNMLSPTIFSLFKFYLTDQYGTSYILYEIPRLFFGYSATGYHFFNILFRLLASLAIYSLAFWWTKKKIFGMIAALFFAIGLPGIDSTLWVVQYYSYIGVILLCLSLFFWKKFHDYPTVYNLKLSVLFFGLALFISHIRIYGLPLILLIGEIYYFLQDKKREKHYGLKVWHRLFLLLIFLILFFSSNSMTITNQIFKMVSPIILLKALINGYPPIIHSYFLFISNLVLPQGLLVKLGEYLKLNSYLANLEAVVFSVLIINSIFLGISLIKKNFLISLFSLWAFAYPISLYITSKGVDRWQPFLPSMIFGGTFFILIILTILMKRENNKKAANLAMLGCLIIIIHLILPWVGYPDVDSNIQAAYNSLHRYYTVPLMGIGLLFGFLFTIALNSIKDNINFQYKNIFFGVILMLVSVLLVMHGLVTYQTLSDRAKIFDKSRSEERWQIIKPFFVQVADKHADIVVYFEGELTKQERYAVKQFTHRLTLEMGFTGLNTGRIGNLNNVLFIDDRQKIKDLFSQDQAVYQELNIIPPLPEENFFAFRFDKKGLVDIKPKVVKELKDQI